MGAYLVLYPRARVHTLFIIIIIPTRVQRPAPGAIGQDQAVIIQLFAIAQRGIQDADLLFFLSH